MLCTLSLNFLKGLERERERERKRERERERERSFIKNKMLIINGFLNYLHTLFSQNLLLRYIMIGLTINRKKKKKKK